MSMLVIVFLVLIACNPVIVTVLFSLTLLLNYPFQIVCNNGDIKFSMYDAFVE